MTKATPGTKKPAEPKVAPATTTAEKKKRHAMARAGRVKGSKSLTLSEKAEAAALWRGGEVTLADLAKKFKRRPETFSRLFARMGIKKGTEMEETAKRMAAAVAARAISSIEETHHRIASMKEEQYKMSSGLAKLAWAELVRARQAGLDIGGLKDIMQTLKLAGEIIGTSRKELYAILKVEEVEKTKELDDLPELVVRELTQGEVGSLRDQGAEDLAFDADPGADMLDDDSESA